MYELGRKALGRTAGVAGKEPNCSSKDKGGCSPKTLYEMFVSVLPCLTAYLSIFMLLGLYLADVSTSAVNHLGAHPTR